MKKKGRPYLDPLKGRMDEAALKERKRELSNLDYKKKKIEKLRRKAMSTRKDRMGAAGDKEEDDISSDNEDKSDKLLNRRRMMIFLPKVHYLE